MYTRGQKLIFQLLFVICSAALARGQEPAITLSEFRQIVTDSRKTGTTAHLVYIKEFNDNSSTAGDKDSVKYKVKELNKHRRFKVDGILDFRNRSLKSSLTDTRDVDALLKEHNIPRVQKSVVSWSRKLVFQGPYEMELLGIDVSDAPPDLILCKWPGRGFYMFGLISLGIINRELSEDRNPILTEIESGGRSLLNIQLTIERPNDSPIVEKIECDPALGYRFRHIERRINGQLIKETIADDYRDVNGVPYPFLYIDRSFDKDGKIIKETKYVMEKIELGVDLSPDDFKLFIPAGTRLFDSVASMTVHTIEQSGYMGIDDALSIGEKWLLKH